MISLSILALKAHIGSTLFMTGVIWFVQIVHYPLFKNIGKSEFLSYEQSHQTRTTFVVAGTMILELTTGFYIAWQPPLSINYPSTLWNLGLLGVIWASTFLFQVPAHEKLSQDPSHEVMARLVNTNWIRTLAWTARSMIVLSWF